MFSGHGFEGVGGGIGPRQQVIDTAVRTIVDSPGDHGSEIGVRLDAGELAGLGQRGDHGPVLGASV